LCTWRINVSTGFKIILKFNDFRTEYCDDFVQVFDGNPVNDSLVGKFCGLSKPGKIISTSNLMTVKFFSDGSSNFRGFSADYWAVNKSKVI
jgi:cubilin